MKKAPTFIIGAVVCTLLTIIIAALISNKAQGQSLGWRPLPGGSLNDKVITMTSYGGYLWVSGWFTAAGPIGAAGVVRHDGNQWISTPSLPAAPEDFCVYHNELYAFGYFVVGGIRYGVMKWTGLNWQPFATINSGGVVHAAEVYHDTLFVAGEFGSIGTISASSVACWDGSLWQCFPNASAGAWSVVRINDLHAANGALYIAGDFNMLEGVFSFCAAKWNGYVLSPLSVAPNTYVKVITSSNANPATNIYIGGIFPWAGSATTRFIAKEGIADWVNAGNGVQMRVFAATDYHGKPYIGGSGSPGPGDNIGNCGFWNGTQWVRDNNGLASGLIDVLYNDRVHDLLYVGGEFTTAHGDTADFIAYKGGTTLPVSLVAFSCGLEKSENQNGGNANVALEWKTASEVRADHFSISCSYDGVAYHDVAIVAGHGTTSEAHDYRVILENQKTGLNYFRLSEYDFNGVESAYGECAVEIVNSSLYYDLPTKTIICPNCASVHIFDIHGTDLLFLQKENIESRRGGLILSVAKLKQGIYIARDDKTGKTIRFFID